MDGRMSLLTSPFVPEGMVDLMTKLSKKVIKERPPNIYEFAADFFEKMLIERDGSLDKGYGKFRSYTEYCKFMDKMDKKRLNQPTTKDLVTAIESDSNDLPEAVPSSNIEIQGVAIQGVERKSKDSVKNVSINPKYKTQSEKVTKPVVSNVKNVKAKPRKLSSKKPSENLIVIKEETSADDDDVFGTNEESTFHKAAKVIQNAFRKYISKEKPQNETVAASSGNVSRLSENDAAFIIQKAFKTMIQKLKMSTSKESKIDEDSNKNIVVAVAGQENDILRDKIPNNFDENSEQILTEHLHNVAVNEEYLEPKEIQLEDALNDTTMDMESKQLTKKLENLTASDTVAPIETENDENPIKSLTLNEFLSKESGDEVVEALGNTPASSVDQQEIKHEGNEVEINTNESADQVGIDSNTNNNTEAVEVVDEGQVSQQIELETAKIPDEVPLTELIPNQESETNLNQITTSEIEPVVNTAINDRSNNIESGSDQVENLIGDMSTYGPDNHVESERIQAKDVSDDTLNQPDNEIKHDQQSGESTGEVDEKSEQKQMESVIGPRSIDLIESEQKDTENVKDLTEYNVERSESEGVEITAPLTTTDTTSEINPSSNEELVQSQVEDSQSELIDVVPGATETESTLIPLNEQASDENLLPSELKINENINVEDTIDGLEEKETELINDVNEAENQPKSNDQLFLVENDGIYVNLDVLQDKIGKIAIDDGTGSDDEKSFKLNILEREEILVNQENVQQNEDEHLVKETVIDNDFELPKQNEATKEVTDFEENDNEKIMESQSKDDEGNEEYELAETVVLGDVPLRQSVDIQNKDSFLSTNEDEEGREEVVDLAIKSQKYITTSDVLKVEPKDTKENGSTTEMDEIESSDIELHPMDTTTSTIHQVEENVVNDASANPTEFISEDVVRTESYDAGVEEKEAKNETVEDEQPQKISTTNESTSFVDSMNDESTVELPRESVHEIENPSVEVKDKEDVEIVKDVTSFDKTGKEDHVEIQELTENEKIQIIENEVEILNSEDLEKTLNAVNDLQTLDDESLRHNENEKIVKAATAIQKVFRGYIVRRKNIKTSNDKNQLQLELSAALIIQKYARGYLVRKYLDKANKSNIISVTSNEIKEDQKDPQITEDATITESIPQRPAYSNRFLIPKDSFLERESFADDEDYARTCKELAATSIQKTYRGYRVRRSLKENEFSDNYDDEEFISDDPVEAVGGNQTENVEDVGLVGEDQVDQVSDQVKSVDGDQMQKGSDGGKIISKDEVKSFEGGQVESFVSEEVKNLCSDQIESIGNDQVEGLVGVQEKSICNNEIESLGTDQVERLDNDKIENPGDKTDCVEEVETIDDEKKESFGDDKMESVKNSQVETDLDDRQEPVEIQAHRVISAVLSVAADVLPDSSSFQENVAIENKTMEQSPLKTQEETQDKAQEKLSISQECTDKPLSGPDSILGQVIHDNIHVEGQMQQKFNHMTFRDSAINSIDELSDSSEHADTPGRKPTESIVNTVAESVESKFDDIKSFSYEQLSSDLSDSDENKRESFKESEIDESSRDERDELSEVENFDLSSCGEDSLEAMYYSIRKNEIMLDRMQKQVAGQRESKGDEVESAESETLKMEFPERVTENLDDAMKQVFKSVESSSDYDGGRKDEDDNSTTLDLGLDDSSSINDEKEIETSRHIKQPEEIHFDHEEESESTIENYTKGNEEVNVEDSQSSDANLVEMNADLSQQSDSSFNSSTRFIMKSQSVSEDMMNPIMFAMKRKQALLDQLHVRPYPLQENLSEDHDAFPEHLLSDIDIGNIQRKIFASSVSETDSDYIEPNTTNRRLVRDDFNISTALDHLSTDSDSTIVSAATKIQAGARGFLTRRRLRRTSAGGTSISFEKRYSFGNAAIDKSLEDLIKRQEQINLDGAALKIQQQYRRYQERKKNLKKVSPIREQTLELSGGSSVEGNDEENIGITEIKLAQKKSKSSSRDEVKLEDYETEASQDIQLNIDELDTVRPVKKTPVNQRRLTLQRGDAVQRNSRPDSPEFNLKEPNLITTGNQGNGKFKDSETGEYTGSIISKKEKKVTSNINIQSLINRGIGPRQRSMPVQIDSELMRIIPKHLRKRVKSADIAKKKSHL